MTHYEDIEKNGLNTVDKKHYLAHLAGGKLTPTQTIHAKCYECMGYYIDGKIDCGIETCPNYPFHRYNPHRIKVKRILTDEQREELSRRFKNIKKR